MVREEEVDKREALESQACSSCSLLTGQMVIGQQAAVGGWAEGRGHFPFVSLIVTSFGRGERNLGLRNPWGEVP